MALPLPPPLPTNTITPRYNRPIRRNANIVGFGLILFYLVSMFSGLLLYGLARTFIPMPFREQWSELLEGIIDTVNYIIVFLVPWIVMMFMIKIPFRVAFPSRAPKPSMTIAAVFCSLGVSVIGMYLAFYVSICVQGIFGVTPTMPDMSAPTTLPAMVVYFINIAIAPAILEEMVFRGVIMQSLRRFGDSFALVTSAILFAMAHGNLVQGPNTLLVGLAIGYFVLRTGSLWTGIIIHFVNNGMAVVLEIIMLYTTEQQDELLNLSILGIYAIGGIIAFIYLLLRHKGMFRLVPSDYPVREGKKYLIFFTSVLPILLLLITIYITSFYFE